MNTTSREERSDFISQPFMAKTFAGWNEAAEWSAFYAAELKSDSKVKLNFNNEYSVTEIIALLPLPASKRVLEIGCGNNFLLHLLKRMGYHVTVMDIAPEAIVMSSSFSMKPEEFVGVVDGLSVSVPLPNEKGIRVHKTDPKTIFKWLNECRRDGGTLDFITGDWFDATIGIWQIIGLVTAKRETYSKIIIASL